MACRTGRSLHSTCPEWFLSETENRIQKREAVKISEHDTSDRSTHRACSPVTPQIDSPSAESGVATGDLWPALWRWGPSWAVWSSSPTQSWSPPVSDPSCWPGAGEPAPANSPASTAPSCQEPRCPSPLHLHLRSDTRRHPTLPAAPPSWPERWPAGRYAVEREDDTLKRTVKYIISNLNHLTYRFHWNVCGCF